MRAYRELVRTPRVVNLTAAQLFARLPLGIMSLAVLHSGVTRAPVIGQGLAQEILAGEEEPLLAPYRPQRFLAAAPGASGP